jgi:tripartite-type tricarboxylate transporter receptor subunit TctC
MRNLCGFVVAVLLALSGGAQAQTDYPTKPVTIIVPYAAGGPSDVVTRVLAEELSKFWHQQVIIENRTGAGTSIGNALAARAKADGYTLLMVSPAFTILPGIRSSLPYDTLKDFRGICIFVDAPQVFASHPGFAPNTLSELIAEARKHKDRPLTYASAGVAGATRMAAELLQKRANIKLTLIAYKGASEALGDTLAGRVDFQVGTWADLRPHIESGKLKLISVMYRNRVPEAANVPTADESNPDLDLPKGAFNGLVVQADAPSDVVSKISSAVSNVITSAGFKERILALGSYPRQSTPEETDAFIKKEVKTWSEIAKAANIRAD